MEEYLKTLLEQIRCKKARSLIEEELRGHLEEQIEENRMSGMEPEEAEKAAVLDMGDPVRRESLWMESTGPRYPGDW